MKNAVVFIALGCAALGAGGLLLRQSAQAQSSAAPLREAASREKDAQEHQQWLSSALKKVETLRPGMTRGDLAASFTQEARQMTSPGLPGGDARRTFSLRECPLIKVEFEFLPAKFHERKYWLLQDRGSLWAGHSAQSDDVIVRMSKPILER